NYDGWNRLDLALVMALLLCVAVTYLWFRIFGAIGHGSATGQPHERPVMVCVLAVIAATVILADALIFYIGLSSRSATGWSNTPAYVPAVATAIFVAGLALIGAWHHDYHSSGAV
ncbi:MAG: hypothetical protein ABI619_09350, partial [Betaproteobacteria bacterium]